MVSLGSGFKSLYSPLSCFVIVFAIMCVPLYCSSDEIEGPYADRTSIYIFELQKN